MGLKFRPKPAIVEAFQLHATYIAELTGKALYKQPLSEPWWPEWLGAAWSRRPSDRNSLFLVTSQFGRRSVNLSTSGEEDNRQEIQPGDWIVRDMRGNLEGCKPDDFAKLYEEVPDDKTDGAGDAGLAGKVETYRYHVGLGIDF